MCCFLLQKALGKYKQICCSILFCKSMIFFCKSEFCNCLLIRQKDGFVNHVDGIVFHESVH
jgi:hypothetical protein